MNEDEQAQAAEEFFGERSAIMEFMGEQSLETAEAAAREETKEHMFRCLIRQLIRWKNQGRRVDVMKWLDKSDVEPIGRDPAERKRYADALNNQIALGNSGASGEWK